jgi:hypothetical protein
MVFAFLFREFCFEKKEPHVVLLIAVVSSLNKGLFQALAKCCHLGPPL